MHSLPTPIWPTIALAVVLVGDAVLSLRPPAFIRDCLDSVHFPREWWWVLIVAKVSAAAGLIAGLWVPGLAMAATVGVVIYFLCAAGAHIRARALGSAFWLNCLGMLAFATVVLLVSYW